jgi:serine/threonine protein kinase
VQAVAQVHACDVVLFDLKLDSLVWDTLTDTVRLIDFNAAVWSDEQQRWMVAGWTPDYSAPEVEASAPGVDKLADIYSMGVVFLSLAVRVVATGSEC